jgi:hypothetical protein
MTQNWMIFIVGQALLLAAAILKIWNDSQVKMARMDERLNNAMSNDETLFNKLDKISTQLTELSIQLSNKQDK